MANFITNTVTSTNFSILLERLTRADDKDERIVDFNIAVPVPLDLYNTEATTGYIAEPIERIKNKTTFSIKQLQETLVTPLLEKMYNSTLTQKEFISLFPINEDSNFTKTRFIRTYSLEGIPTKKQNECIINILKQFYNLKKYNYIDWYSYCIDNWGCKWNAETTCITENSVIFNTAWSCPVKFFITLSKIPNIGTITVCYSDEDIGSNYGILQFTDGKVTELLSNENKSIGESYACRMESIENMYEDYCEDNYSDEEIREYFNTNRGTFFEKNEKDYTRVATLIESLL